MSVKSIELHFSSSVKQNVETFDIEDEILNIWTHVSVSYSQTQFSFYLNGQLKHQKELDLRSPFKNSDGLQFLDQFIGQFTEIWFWTSGLT